MRAIAIARRSMYIENVKVFFLCGLQRLTAGPHCSDVFSVAGSGEQEPFWWGGEENMDLCWMLGHGTQPDSSLSCPVMLLMLCCM